MLGLMLVIFSCTIYAQKTTHKKELEHNVKELFISPLRRFVKNVMMCY